MKTRRSDNNYVPQGRERILMRGNYMEINNYIVSKPLTHTWGGRKGESVRSAPARLRVFMVILRNTYGRGKECDTESMSYIGERMGYRGVDMKTRGMHRNNVRTHTKWLEEWFDLRRSGSTGKMNSWSLGYGLNDIKPGRRYAINLKEFIREARWSPNPSDYDDDEEWQNAQDEWEQTPHFKTDYFQWPTCFEDVMGPNIPYRLYALLMKVWAETVGRVNHARDGYDRMFDWYANLKTVGEYLGVSDRKTIKDYISFAEKWGFITVNRRGSKKTAYRPGPHLWRLAKTGDLSPAYIEAFNVTTRCGYPALYTVDEKRNGKVASSGRVAGQDVLDNSGGIGRITAQVA